MKKKIFTFSLILFAILFVLYFVWALAANIQKEAFRQYLSDEWSFSLSDEKISIEGFPFQFGIKVSNFQSPIKKTPLTLKFSKLEIVSLIYNLSDVVISSSIEPEAFGRVAIESQSMEKPILASDIGGSLETIKNNKTGWLFKNNDVSDLAEKIQMILESDQAILDSIGRQGRKNVKENYTREFMVSRTLEIYKSLVY